MHASNLSELDAFLESRKPIDSGAAFGPGDVFGDWRITAFIGKGGNGEVYRGEHMALGTVAALKVHVPHLGKTDSQESIARHRFEHETVFLSHNEYPFFPRFYDSGESNGYAYLVIELLEPAILPSSDKEIATFLLEVGRAVDALHSKGLVHRDIKPQNIMRRHDGTLVLIDMGLVKELTVFPDHAVTSMSIVDGKAVGVGTLRYSAPEQFSGDEVSPATDIHALGMIANECFKGRPPREWERIISRSTSSIPDRRYHDVAAFATAVRHRHWRTYGWWLFGCIAAFCMVVAAMLFAGKPTPPKYCIVDISAGASANSYPVSYVSAEPFGGFNTPEYKTTKIVLRRIWPGTFRMCGEYDVTIAKPFYIGVFEVTQRQYELVTGFNPSNRKGDMRPVDSVSWSMIRGDSSVYDWPNTSNVDSSTFIGRIRARTGLAFDLPTEAQWEYACRAGTTSDYNNGGSTTNDLNMLARYAKNTIEGRGGYVHHTTVGSYQPNAWGLYDMHGNVWEWCLDWRGSLLHLANGAVDPVGRLSGSARCVRGGGWANGGVRFFVSSFRGSFMPSRIDDTIGFRLAL